MFKEITLDPRCMTQFEYYVQIYQQKAFGYNRGRYLTFSMPEWVDEAIDYVKQSELRTMEKKRVKNFLNKIRKEKGFDGFIYPSFRQNRNTEGLDWYSWMTAQDRYCGFSAIIFSEETKKAKEGDSLLEAPSNWDVPPSARVSKNEKVIIDELDALLRISKEILIVDRYICLYDHDVLRELTLRIVSKRYSIKKVMIVTNKKTEPKGGFANQYSVPNGVDLIVEMVVYDNPGWFHDRYVITDRGAVFFGQGILTERKQDDRHQGKLQLGLVTKKDADEVRDHVERLLTGKNARKKLLYSSSPVESIP